MHALTRHVALLVSSLLAIAASADEETFRPLFNGEDLGGWVQRGGKATYAVDADAEGGAQIVGTSVAGEPNAFLCTERDYDDFVLEFEVWVDPALNSGVQFRSQCFDENKSVTLDVGGEKKSFDIPAGRVHGYQVEIDPSNRAWSGGVYDEARRGWLSSPEGEDHAEAREAFKVGAWNLYRVEAHGNHISTSVNGVEVAHLHDDVTPKGFIALQVHSIESPEQAGKRVRWRNLRINEIE